VVVCEKAVNASKHADASNAKCRNRSLISLVL
jgi:hypothetical protein